MTTPAAIGRIACAGAVLSLVDPRLSWLGPACAVLCFLCLCRSAPEGLVFAQAPYLLGMLAGWIARTGYSLEADTMSYMANVASLLRDQDLDIANQIREWTGRTVSVGPGGMALTPHPVGNAFVWAIPVLLAHGYALVFSGYHTNFFSPPYFGAVIVTNGAIAITGAIAIGRALAPHVRDTAAALALAIGVLASPIFFYLTVYSVMAHALTFGLAAWVVALTLRAEGTDSMRDWRILGAVLGVAISCRLQAVVLFALLPLVRPMTVRGLGRRLSLVLPVTLLFGIPQAYAWFRTFGLSFRVPQGPGFFDARSPHWTDTLFSADRGLFNWHPLLLLGVLGLLFVRAPLRRLSIAGLVVFTLTTWVNGTIWDFNGSDAFGGRRYDVAIPFLIVGLARLFHALRPMLTRSPLALPSMIAAIAILWNLSFMDLYRARVFPEGAPPEDLAAAQVRQAERVVSGAFGWIGPAARFRIYDAFSGRYTYRGFRPGGDFDLAELEGRYLAGGWSEPHWWDEAVRFRYLLFPRACIGIPLDEPFDLRGHVLARSPARIHDQRLTLALNGHVLTEASLPAEWTELPFEAPKALWVAGLNEFCVTAAKKRPGDEGDDLAFAAAVVRVQLP